MSALGSSLFLRMENSNGQFKPSKEGKAQHSCPWVQMKWESRNSYLVQSEEAYILFPEQQTEGYLSTTLSAETTMLCRINSNVDKVGKK